MSDKRQVRSDRSDPAWAVVAVPSAHHHLSESPTRSKYSLVKLSSDEIGTICLPSHSY